ncbi:MAG: DUF4003 family protein [Clostridiaceae bacterium]|nr:DUF4003 family protein [Clostridiaceae bacterium]
MTRPNQARIDLFVASTQRLKGRFIWHNDTFKRLAALLYAADNRIADSDAIQASLQLIKGSTGPFSALRGQTALVLAAMLARHPDPRQLLSATQRAYAELRACRFGASDYLAVAACQIAGRTRPETVGQAVERTRAFYDGLKDRHFFLTGADDIIYTAMLGLSEIGITAGLERVEDCYSDLKPYFRSGNAVLALAQVLALGDDRPKILPRVLALRDALRTYGLKLDQTGTLAAFGVLAILPADEMTLAGQVRAADDDLRGRKGFSGWSVTRQERLLLAVSLAALDYTETQIAAWTSTLATSLIDIILAQQTALAVTVAVSAAAASSSS